MMVQVRIDLQGRGKVEAFSWPRVQAMGESVRLALRVARQVRALGQVSIGAAGHSYSRSCRAAKGLYGSAKKIWIASR